MAKAQLELELPRTVGDQKNRGFKNILISKNSAEITSACHLTNRAIKKSCLMLSLPLSSTPVMG